MIAYIGNACLQQLPATREERIFQRRGSTFVGPGLRCHRPDSQFQMAQFTLRRSRSSVVCLRTPGYYNI